jgi:hypothetical protein
MIMNGLPEPKNKNFESPKRQIPINLNPFKFEGLPGLNQENVIQSHRKIS